MLSTYDTDHTHWLDGVHCVVHETYRLDAEKKTRGPSSFTAYTGTKREPRHLSGRFESRESALNALRQFIADNHIEPTQATRTGRVNRKRAVKLTPEDISLLERILARERR